MTPEQAFAFMLFAFVAAVTPGPSNVLLTTAGANAGFWRGLPCLFGVVLGMGFMMFVVAFGLGSLVLGNPAVLSGLKVVGAGFLLWLAWKIATAGRSQGPDERPPVGFVAAAAFQWINPKSWLVCAGAVGTYLAPQAGSALDQSAAFALLFVLAALPCAFMWLGLGLGVQRLLQTERALRVFNVTMGALLAGSVVFFVT
ncbi:MAG: LysE family translocator [Kiloniellales bacterium]|nr:LysE family translocator [Kiloniellales bacterium]